jgi:NADH pyrophosphatase NudC (nudix superfamily)
MKTKGNWVIKTSGGGYWCGNSYFDPQLRKAQVYHWKEKAEEQIEVIKKRKYFAPDMEYEIVAISEPKELKDTEASWYQAMPEDLICSNCEYSALNDYRGNPVASKFCPHCGKYMTNHTQPEDDE